MTCVLVRVGSPETLDGVDVIHNVCQHFLCLAAIPSLVMMPRLEGQIAFLSDRLLRLACGSQLLLLFFFQQGWGLRHAIT